MGRPVDVARSCISCQLNDPREWLDLSRLDYIVPQEGDLLDKDAQHQEPVRRYSLNRKLQRGEEEVHKPDRPSESPQMLPGNQYMPERGSMEALLQKGVKGRQGERAAPANRRSTPTLPQESS